MNNIEYLIDEIDSLKALYPDFSYEMILKIIEIDRMDSIIDRLNELVDK